MHDGAGVDIVMLFAQIIADVVAGAIAWCGLLFRD